MELVVCPKCGSQLVRWTEKESRIVFWVCDLCNHIEPAEKEKSK